jgi:hypothetical protein
MGDVYPGEAAQGGGGAGGQALEASVAQIWPANSGSIDDKLSQRFQQALKVRLQGREPGVPGER